MQLALLLASDLLTHGYFRYTQQTKQASMHLPIESHQIIRQPLRYSWQATAGRSGQQRESSALSVSQLQCSRVPAGGRSECSVSKYNTLMQLHAGSIAVSYTHLTLPTKRIV